MKTSMKTFKKLERKLLAIVATVMIAVSKTLTAYAASGDEQTASDAMDSVLGTVASWASKGGLAVAFVGAIMLGFAIKNNDAEQKQNALLTMVAGGAVAAICGLISSFGFGGGAAAGGTPAP